MRLPAARMAMQTLEALSDLIQTTDDIRGIVRTMKSLSAVSIRQYENAEAALTGYERTIDLGFAALLQDRRARGLPLPATLDTAATREALIVIGSDRGLCGRYNEIVTGHAMTRMAGGTAVLAVAGARAAARLEARGQRVDRLFSLPGTVAGMSPLVQRMIVEIEGWTREPGVGHVRLVHNRRKGRSRAVPVDRMLLPVPDAYLRRLERQGWPGRGRPVFRMAPDRLLSWLVRQRLFVVLYRALAEALASEHATRLAAMHNAERNIDERRETLNALYRRKRQAKITDELMDVVAGYEAVRSGRE